MTHEQTVRIIPGAKTAVLFMHGIAGTPEHFRSVLPLEGLVPEEFSVYNVLYDGHGKQVEDFARSSMEKWKQQVMKIFDDLCQTHEQVIPVGHSMGSLFAVQMALRRPEKVPFIFLINCPLRVGVKPAGALNLIRLSYGLLDMEDPVQASTSKVTSIQQTWMSWRYIGWLPRVAELLQEMKFTSGLFQYLTVPCIAFQSKGDELVSCRSCDILRRSGNVEIHGLRNSTHFYYAPREQAAVRRRFRQLLNEYQ
ncbi:MAG: alpha/beta fold hydrolase [Oscillospiraceae bacterium]|nr:alpha/beta fold hydrolase [Oscillospiraceae bacterium]